MLTEKEIAGLVNRIVECVDPEEVIVFGSYAKQRATRRSDLDLLIVKETELPKRYRRDMVEHLLSTFLVSVDLHVHTPEEVEVYREEADSFVSTIYRTGRVFYKRA
jgi:predicted nucleotidyltransferase